jgi:N-acetylmuramoyl-L-alanine amidase
MITKFLLFPTFFVLLLTNQQVVQGKQMVSCQTSDSRVSVVVIDPGHGGKDPGAVVGNAREKQIVLDISLKLGNLIKTAFPETKVVYTRDKDFFIPLHQRANIANKNNADLFISIHANYVDSRSVQGTETFVLGQHRSQDNLEVAKKENSVILLEDDYEITYEGFDPNSPESYIMFELVQDEYLEQSVMFASSIQEQFREKAKRYDRSVKQAGFLVLRQTTMPGVLVEAGFLSHSSERNFLMTEAGRMDIATSIFNAFKNYKRKIEEKSSFSIVSNEKPVEKKNETPPETVVKPAPEKITSNSSPVRNVSFSIQVAASVKRLETTPSNFKGEKNIFRIGAGNIHRYYLGKFDTYEKALEEKARLEKKFPDSFIVAFENDKLITLKKAMEKM